MTGTPPKPKSNMRWARLPPDLLEVFDERAKRPGTTTSGIIVAALRKYLKVPEPNTQVWKATMKWKVKK